jgi:hypothetical protein
MAITRTGLLTSALDALTCDAQRYHFRLDSFQHVLSRLVLVVPASLDYFPAA